MLSKRNAKLRATSLSTIGSAQARLDGRYAGAFYRALYDQPRAALRAIALAEAKLAKAKRALRAWARA